MLRQVYTTTFLLLLIAVVGSAQVDIYLFHPEWKSFKLGNIQNLSLYNKAGVPIDGMIDVQIRDNYSNQLVYHIRTANATYPAGKTRLNAYFRNQQTIVDQLEEKSLPLSNHQVQIQLIHPLDNTSIIAAYTYNTKNCGTENGYIASRERNFYVIAHSYAAYSREPEWSKEGLTLTYELKLPNRIKNPLGAKDVSLDIRNSRLLSLKDNTGKDYQRESFFTENQRQEYFRAQAQKGMFMYSGEKFRGLRKDKSLFQQEGLLFAQTRLLGLPKLATNLTAEGYLAFNEHTDDIITTEINVELKEGNSFELNGHRISLSINGAGTCGNTPFQIMSLKSGLKIKAVQIKNPIVTACESYGPDNHIKVLEDQLPYQAQLVISYYRPIKHHIYFSTQFNLGLNPEAVKIQADQYYEFGLSGLELHQTPNREGNCVEATFPIELPKELSIRPRQSAVIFKTPDGQQIDLGKTKIKDDYGRNKAGTLTITASQLPKTKAPYLLAEMDLLLQKDNSSTEEFEFVLKSANDNLPVEIDAYPVQAHVYENAMNFIIQEGNFTYSGDIPGRTIVRVEQKTKEGLQELEAFGNRYQLKETKLPTTIVLTTYQKDTEHRILKKKLALGAMIDVGDPSLPRQAKAGQDVPSKKPISKPAPIPQEVENAPVRKADIPPIFPGCEQDEGSSNNQVLCSAKKILEYVYQHPSYLADKSPKGDIRVIVKFIVEKDGSLSSFETVMSPSQKHNQVAIKIMQDLNKRWTPATIDGQAVRFSYLLPLRF